MSAERKSYFRMLPPEVVVPIFGAISLKDKKNCRLVCPRWRRILDEPDYGLTSFSICRYMSSDEAVKYFFNSYRTFEKVVVDMDWTFPPMTDCENKFPKIRNVVLAGRSCGENGHIFLQHACNDSESLNVKPLAFANLELCKLSQILPEVKWTRMTTLKISAEGEDYSNPQQIPNNGAKHLVAVGEFLKFSTIPTLKNVEIRICQTCFKYYPEIEYLFSEFYGFVNRHTDSIKDIALEFSFDLGDTNPLPLKVTNEVQESIGNNLKLESLAIKFDGHKLPLVLPCLWNGRTLETLSVDAYSTKHPDYIETRYSTEQQSESLLGLFKNVMKPSKKSLLNVTLGNKFDIRCFQNMTSLMYLALMDIMDSSRKKIFPQ